MRFIVKSLVVVLVAFGVGNYLIYLKTGQFPVNNIRENYNGDWMAAIKESFSVDKLLTSAKKNIDEFTDDEAAKPAPTKVYKWTDANGQVHYGDKPQNVAAEQVDVKIQNAISAPDQQAAEAIVDGPVSAQQQTPIEKARSAADAMKARTQAQEAN